MYTLNFSYAFFFVAVFLLPHFCIQITDKLQEYKDSFESMTQDKNDLERKLELCEQKKDRATKMIGGLGGEKDRWSQAAKNLQLAYDNIVGDVLLSSGVVAYLGGFTVDFRQVSAIL